MSLNEEFITKRKSDNELVDNQEFLPYKRFFALDSRAYDEGEIPIKYKEMIGLTSSMVLRCNECINYHLNQCVKIGCTRNELNEAMNIALIVGGSIVIPHLRFALEILDELLPLENM